MLNSITKMQLSFKAQPEQVKDLDREKTVAILGSSKDTPYNDMARTIAYDLSKQGFNIVTGGGYGIMKAANEGAWSADPTKSWAVQSKEWIDKHDKQIFNELTTVDKFADRTNLFRKIAKYWVVFPGGPGSLEEISVGGEAKYYNTSPFPDKIILVGKQFYEPFVEFLKKMNQFGVAKNAEQTYDIADHKNEVTEKIIGSRLDKVA